VAGETLRSATYSRLAPKHRLAAWVRLLALSAGHPGRRFDAASVGRGRGRHVAVVRIPPLEPGAARAQLDALVDLYDRGMREPLPLYCATSAAWAEAAAAGRDPAGAAREAWTSKWRFDKEDRELEHQLVLGRVRGFDDVLAEPASPDEGWEPGEPTRLGALARRLWDGLRAAEEPG
jgi:exodeoxyribonuclease V gamma subunit